MMLVRVALVCMLMLLASCGGKREVIVNPYLERAHDDAMTGLDFMRRERWRAAERAFARALRAAQLADDPALVRKMWYNLGIVRSAMRHHDEAAEAFRRCIELAGREGDDVMRMRARLALALMQVRLHRPSPAPAPLGPGWPADVYLQSGRLLQLQGRAEAAEKAYQAAISRSGVDRRGMRIRADAAMGLALLRHQAGDDAQARKHLENALSMARRIGAPRLSAHALLLWARISPERTVKKDRLERALAIYAALQDRRGQQQALTALQTIAEQEDDREALQRIRLRLENLKASQ